MVFRPRYGCQVPGARPACLISSIACNSPFRRRLRSVTACLTAEWALWRYDVTGRLTEQRTQHSEDCTSAMNCPLRVEQQKLVRGLADESTILVTPKKSEFGNKGPNGRPYWSV